MHSALCAEGVVTAGFATQSQSYWQLSFFFTIVMMVCVVCSHTKLITTSKIAHGMAEIWQQPVCGSHWDHNTQTLYFPLLRILSPNTILFSFSMEMKFQPFVRTREKCLYRDMLNIVWLTTHPPNTSLRTVGKMLKNEHGFFHRFLRPSGIRIGNICMQDKDKASKIALTWSIRAFDRLPAAASVLRIVLINQKRYILLLSHDDVGRSIAKKNSTKMCCNQS